MPELQPMQVSNMSFWKIVIVHARSEQKGRTISVLSAFTGVAGVRDHGDQLIACAMPVALSVCRCVACER